ncbi:hypothetical protein NBRC116188_10830 [Oceaniserpentilla sp. 4NH20-0058]|uniref:hypothetical protein n=1 Tax=Oceaniserpentilla sp. 4NH20-0058 TaxID=3127660 RepID=UPI003102B25B
MVLFLSIQQELDCINNNGTILGKIKFDHSQGAFKFEADNASISMSDAEKISIEQKLLDLASGKCSIPMQDDD